MPKLFFVLSITILLYLFTAPSVAAKRPIYYGKEMIKLPGFAPDHYNIYYRQASDKSYKYSVSVPGTSSTYTISYLKMWEYYYYKIAAAYSSGKEYWWSKEVKFTPQERTHTVRDY